MTAQANLAKQEHRELQTEGVRGGRTYLPNVDILETPTEFTLRAEMPGVRSEDVDVTYERGELRIHGRVTPRQRAEETNWIYREYGVGDFYRTFRIGEGIDGGAIHAELSDGVLTLHCPKSQEVLPRKISVRTN